MIKMNDEEYKMRNLTKKMIILLHGAMESVNSQIKLMTILFTITQDIITSSDSGVVWVICDHYNIILKCCQS